MIIITACAAELAALSEEARICDGTIDCQDRSDEKDCPTSEPPSNSTNSSATGKHKLDLLGIVDIVINSFNKRPQLSNPTFPRLRVMQPYCIVITNIIIIIIIRPM